MPADTVAPERNDAALEGTVEAFGAGKALLLRVEADGLRALGGAMASSRREARA